MEGGQWPVGNGFPIEHARPAGPGAVAALAGSPCPGQSCRRLHAPRPGMEQGQMAQYSVDSALPTGGHLVIGP